MPQFFTQEKKSPSETTINIIKQIAYTYRCIRLNDECKVFCVN